MIFVRGLFLAFLACLGCSLAFVCMFFSATGTGLLVLAVMLGGAGGGFTLGLVGGERYGLKLPGTHDSKNQKYDPGYLGDVFVGLMAAFLGIGLASRTLKTDLFGVEHAPLIELWFLNFALAYVFGFLGLRLVKGLSERLLQEFEIKEGLAQVEKNEGATAFLSGQTALQLGQVEEAEMQFRKALCIDSENNRVRALIGLASVQRRKGQLGDAIATLSDAIDLRAEESVKGRIAVAYWNRACYRALAQGAEPQNLQQVIDDLRESIRIQPAYRQDLLKEEDLQSVREEPTFKALL